MNPTAPLYAFRLGFAPDRFIPRFLRLQWERCPVSLEDVLETGVHPWSEPNSAYRLRDAFLDRLNRPETRLPELEPHGYSDDLRLASEHHRHMPQGFEDILDTVRRGVYFVDTLSYRELRDIASAKLRARWDHDTARRLATEAHGGFSELRRFLKRKAPSLRLSGFQDLDRKDLSEVLTVDDFQDRDALVIRHGIPTPTFRRRSWLDSVADTRGRLRLTERIDHLTLAQTAQPPDYMTVLWRVARHGRLWRFCPELGDDRRRREHAAAFAARWRVDEGRLCFLTSLESMTAMTQSGTAFPSFPSLNYRAEQAPSKACATVDGPRVWARYIGSFPTRRSTNETLKEVLNDLGASQGGTKEQLLQRIAIAAAQVYREGLPELDEYFQAHRFVRIASRAPDSRPFPLLEERGLARNLLLTLYVMRHLRGDVILEGGRENAACTAEELALALLLDKICLTGTFLDAE